MRVKVKDVTRKIININKAVNTVQLHLDLTDGLDVEKEPWVSIGNLLGYVGEYKKHLEEAIENAECDI